MTATLKTKGERFYAVINYKDNGEYKQKWISLGLPVKNNKRRAEAMLDEIKREYEERYSTTSGDVLFTTYISKWLYNKKDLVELSTWEGYQIYAERHIIPYFEPKKLSIRDVRPHHIKEYYDYKYRDGRLDGKPGGLSIAALIKHSIVIKEVFNYAMLEDMVTRNPASGVKMPAKKTTQCQRVFLDENDANVVLKAFKGHPLEALVYITLYYGLRRSEIIGLRWRAVDFENNKITINHTVVKNRTIVRKDKTKSASSNRTFVLLDDVRRVLLERKKQQDREKEEYGDGYDNNDYIFTRGDGTLFRPDYVTRGFQRVLKNHGLQNMRFHDLRHSTATILYDKGWGLKDSQLWLGHSSVEITGDLYTHISAERKMRLASGLNSTLQLDDEK